MTDYVISAYTTSAAPASFGADYTMTTVGSIDQALTLTKVEVQFNQTGNATAKAVVYDHVGTTKIGEGALQTLTGVALGTWYALPCSIALAAGTSYRVGWYNASGGPYAAHTNETTLDTFVSSPAGVTYTEQDTYIYYRTGDAVPTQGRVAGELIMRLTLSGGSASPTVAFTQAGQVTFHHHPDA